MSVRSALLLGTILAVASVGTCCDVNSVMQLNRCVKNQLEADDQPRKLGNLSLQDASGGFSKADGPSKTVKMEWWTSNITMHGLDGYSYDNVNFDCSNRTTLRMNLSLSWPASSVIITANATVRTCTTERGCSGNVCRLSTHCRDIVGSEDIALRQPTARLETVLDVSVEEGSVKATQRDADFAFSPSVTLPDYYFQTVGNASNLLLILATDKYEDWLINTWWVKEQKVVEGKIGRHIRSVMTGN